MLDKDAIKESLEEHDIIRLLTDLGSQPPKRSGQGDLMFNTVCHGGDSHKLYYYESSHIFRCYTKCGCNMDIYELVMRVRNVDFQTSVRYVADLTGKHYTKSAFVNQMQQSYMIDDWQWLNRFASKPKPYVELPTYSSQVLDVFVDIEIGQWIEEGISPKTMKKFGISYYINDERIVMPHLDINGRLVGIRGRTTNPIAEAEGKKYMPLTVNKVLYNHPTAFNLYGLYQNLETIKRLKKIAIFESEKSVLKCEDFYEGNNFAVAVCGSNISNQQRDMILETGVEEVIICFDKEYVDVNGDKAKAYIKKLLNLAHKFTPYCRVCIVFDEWELLEDKDSPCDKGREVLETLMRNKFEVETKRVDEEEEEV